LLNLNKRDEQRKKVGEKQRGKNSKLQVLIYLIVVGTNLPAIIFAAVGFAVVHRY